MTPPATERAPICRATPCNDDSHPDWANRVAATHALVDLFNQAPGLVAVLSDEFDMLVVKVRAVGTYQFLLVSGEDCDLPCHQDGGLCDTVSVGRYVGLDWDTTLVEEGPIRHGLVQAERDAWWESDEVAIVGHLQVLAAPTRADLIDVVTSALAGR